MTDRIYAITQHPPFATASGFFSSFLTAFAAGIVEGVFDDVLFINDCAFASTPADPSKLAFSKAAPALPGEPLTGDSAPANALFTPLVELEIAVSTGECLADVDGAAGGVAVDTAWVTDDWTDWAVGTGGRAVAVRFEPLMAGDASPE